MPAAPPLSPGDRFTERYRVEGLLGQGGMGAVYRVTDLALDEPVALKVLTGADQASAVARFLREVKLARRVTHPNVARVFDLGGGEGQLFFTMELCEGDTLRARMRRGALPWVDARPLLLSMLRGLRAIHEAGIVHRDLKPGNVLFDASGRLVLADFGIARGDERAGELTQGAIGTPLYMAPEQAAGLAVDARADLFALARITAEMLRGRARISRPRTSGEISRRGASPPRWRRPSRGRAASTHASARAASTRSSRPSRRRRARRLSRSLRPSRCAPVTGPRRPLRRAPSARPPRSIRGRVRRRSSPCCPTGSGVPPSTRTSARCWPTIWSTR